MVLLPSSNPPTTTVSIAPSTSPDIPVELNLPQTTQQGGVKSEDAMTAAAADCKADDLMDVFLDSDTTEHIAKYNRYEADYVRRLKAKYFSKKAFDGGKQSILEIPYEGQ